QGPRQRAGGFEVKSRKSLCPLLLLVALMIGSISYAQQYDLLIKRGHLIDPKNNIDSVMDIAITGDRIAAVESNIPPGQANRVIDATGLYVSPGLVDLHAHVFYGTEPNASYSNGYSAIPPDGFTFRSGLTQLVISAVPGRGTFRLSSSRLLTG